MSKLNRKKKKTPGNLTERTGLVLHSPVTLKVSLMRGFGGNKYAIKTSICGYKHHLSVVQKPFYINQENFDNKMMFDSLKSWILALYLNSQHPNNISREVIKLLLALDGGNIISPEFAE